MRDLIQALQEDDEQTHNVALETPSLSPAAVTQELFPSSQH